MRIQSFLAPAILVFVLTIAVSPARAVEGTSARIGVETGTQPGVVTDTRPGGHKEARTLFIRFGRRF